MSNFLELITEPMQYTFMQRALIMSILIGFICSIFSCFLILKGWSLMGDAISHAILPGVVLAYILTIPLSIGAFISGLFTAIITGYIKENSRLKEDSIMGIVFSGMFALGMLMYINIQPDIHLDHILFGNILGIQNYDLWETSIICTITLIIIILYHNDLLLYCFDKTYAKVIGLSVKIIHYTLLVILSLTIVASLKAIGTILVIATLITPGAIAYLLSDCFSKMIIISSAVSIGSNIYGIFLSFYLNSDPSATIILIQTIIFIITFLFAPKTGIFIRKKISI